jgi:hypothetical protein
MVSPPNPADDLRLRWGSVESGCEHALLEEFGFHGHFPTQKPVATVPFRRHRLGSSNSAYQSLHGSKHRSIHKLLAVVGQPFTSPHLEHAFFSWMVGLYGSCAHPSHKRAMHRFSLCRGVGRGVTSTEGFNRTLCSPPRLLTPAGDDERQAFAAVIDRAEDGELTILALPVYNVPHFSAFFRFTRKFTKRRKAQVYKWKTL